MRRLIRRRFPAEPPVDLPGFRRRIRTLVIDGDIAAAESALAEARAAFPGEVGLAVDHAWLIELRDGVEASVEHWDSLLREPAAELPRGAFVHAAQCHRRLRRLDRAEQIVTKGLVRYPKALGILREAAGVAMARKDWTAAAARWGRYWERRTAKDGAHRDGRLPSRSPFGDWFEPSWSEFTEHFVHATRDWPHPSGASFHCALARTLQASDLPEEALVILDRAIADFPEDPEVFFELAKARLTLGLTPPPFPAEVDQASASLASALAALDAPTVGLGPIRILRVPRLSSLELALRHGHFIDSARLRLQTRELSMRDHWPEMTSETNLLLDRAREAASTFADKFAEAPHLPKETLADALLETLHNELATYLPMRRLARDLASTTGDEPVVIHVPSTSFSYLGGTVSGHFDLLYLYFELMALGCNAYLCVLDHPDGDNSAFNRVVDDVQLPPAMRFTPAWVSMTPQIPVRDEVRHGPVGLVPAGIRSVRRVGDRFPTVTIFQSSAVIKEFAYDRSSRQAQPIAADVRLYPQDDVLPTFTFTLAPVADIAGHDMTPASLAQTQAELWVTEPVGGTWLEWLSRATVPLLRHVALRAQEEVERHGLRELHVADHFYAEGIIVGDAVRRAGGTVVLHPHSANPVHVDQRRPESFTSAHAVTRTGVEIWRNAFPDKPVHHTPEGMLGASPPHHYDPDEPISLIVFGGRSVIGHLPVVDVAKHEALHRSFFGSVAELQARHRVNLYFKPRGMTGEREQWLHRIVNETAGWTPVYSHPLKLDLPNMVFASISTGTSALIEGLSRGIPGLIVREFPVLDYTTLDPDTFPALAAADAADLVAACSTEAGYRRLTNRQLTHYREEVALDL